MLAESSFVCLCLLCCRLGFLRAAAALKECPNEQ